MTEPRPPIHPAPGDWPEPSDKLPDYKSLNENARRHNARLRAELAEAADAIATLQTELAAANERAEGALLEAIALRVALYRNRPRKEGGE